MLVVGAVLAVVFAGVGIILIGGLGIGAWCWPWRSRRCCCPCCCRWPMIWFLVSRSRKNRTCATRVKHGLRRGAHA
jgi:hypothetical protein